MRLSQTNTWPNKRWQWLPNSWITIACTGAADPVVFKWSIARGGPVTLVVILPEFNAMLAFQILVNGDVVCTAGASPGHRVLSTIISWTHRDPDQIGFHVGGVPDADQHLDWNVPEIGIGDEVTIRIVETDDIDEPDTARPKIDRTE